MATEKKSAGSRKIIAIMLAVFMLISILFSYRFIIENIHHDCTGENCPICLQIEEAAAFIQSIKYVPVLSFLMAVLFIFTERAIHEIKHIFVDCTLISLKVELLN